MYQNRNTLCAHVLGARFMHMLYTFSGSVFRIAFSSFGWWLVLRLCPRFWYNSVESRMIKGEEIAAGP